VKVSWCAGSGCVGEFRAPFDPAHYVTVDHLSGGSAGTRASVQGGTRATIFGAQPNKRLKLAAPVVTGAGDTPRDGVVEFRL